MASREPSRCEPNLEDASTPLTSACACRLACSWPGSGRTRCEFSCAQKRQQPLDHHRARKCSMYDACMSHTHVHLHLSCMYILSCLSIVSMPKVIQRANTQYAIRNTDTQSAIRRPAHGSNTEYGYAIRNTQTRLRAQYGMRI